MSSNTIKFSCPKCLAEVRVLADSAKGQKRKCWRCKATMIAAFDSDKEEFTEKKPKRSPNTEQQPTSPNLADQPRATHSQPTTDAHLPQTPPTAKVSKASNAESQSRRRKPKQSLSKNSSVPSKFGPINLGGRKKSESTDPVEPQPSAGVDDDDSLESLTAGVGDPIQERTKKPVEDKPTEPEEASNFDPDELQLESLEKSVKEDDFDDNSDDELAAEKQVEVESGDHDEMQLAPNDPEIDLSKQTAYSTPLNDSYCNDDDDDQQDELRIGAPIDLPKYETPSYVSDYESKERESKERESKERESKGRDFKERGANERDSQEHDEHDRSTSHATASPSRDENVKREHQPLELPDRDIPQLAEKYDNETAWFKDMLAFLADAHLIALWIGLTLLMTAQLFFMRWALFYSQQELVYQVVGFFMMGAIAIPLTLIVLVWGSVTGSNVFQQTAEGNKVMSDWPTFDFFGWIGSSFYYVCPLAMSLLPALLVFLISYPFAFGGWLTAFSSLICIFAFFPLLMLSVVYNQSCWNPYAKPIWDSFSDCFPTWKRFYLRCAVLFLVAVALILPQVINSVVAMAISAFGLIFVAFIYFRLLGFAGREIYDHLYRSESAENEEETALKENVADMRSANMDR